MFIFASLKKKFYLGGFVGAGAAFYQGAKVGTIVGGGIFGAVVGGAVGFAAHSLTQ